MQHKGYTGLPQIDEESESLYGHVVGLRDVITFQGENFAELKQSFRESVDEYLDFCESLGRSPEKPFSGQFLLRVAPALHRALAHAAEIKGISLNTLAESILGREVGVSNQNLRRRVAQMPGLLKVPGSRKAAKTAIKPKAKDRKKSAK